MKHVMFVIKSRPPYIDIFWNESNEQEHYMQDLLGGQDLYAIKVDDLTQNHFFPIGE
jgi:hypothetical protein